MGMALMAQEIDRPEFMPFGLYAWQLMAERNVRNAATLDRLMKEDGYEKSLSGQTILNYFKGIHQAPAEFLAQLTLTLGRIKPLEHDQVLRLGKLYAWQQKRPGTGRISAENYRQAQRFIDDLTEEMGSERRAAERPSGA